MLSCVHRVYNGWKSKFLPDSWFCQFSPSNSAMWRSLNREKLKNYARMCCVSLLTIAWFSSVPITWKAARPKRGKQLPTKEKYIHILIYPLIPMNTLTLFLTHSHTVFFVGQVNSYQCVLLMDDIGSVYVLYLYGWIHWIYGLASKRIPGQVMSVSLQWQYSASNVISISLMFDLKQACNLYVLLM